MRSLIGRKRPAVRHLCQYQAVGNEALDIKVEPSSTQYKRPIETPYLSSENNNNRATGG